MRMKGRNHLFRDETGATAVFVSIVFLVMVGMAMLTVDGGTLYMQRRRMVTATDSASLAAAQWCALNFGEAQPDSVVDRSRTTATNNVGDSSQVSLPNSDVNGFHWGPVGASLSSPSTGECNNNSASGQVTSKFNRLTGQVFAPVFGFGSQRTVSATATAVWGPTGAASGVQPFMLSENLSDCPMPPPDIESAPLCRYWWDDDYIGNALWSMIRLDRWNVGISDGCTGSAGTPVTKGWINGTSPALPLNYPDPTYVCIDTGAPRDVFGTPGDTCPPGALSNPFKCKVGQEVLFPVSDPCRVNPPGPSGVEHGGRTSGGLLVGPGAPYSCTPGTPNKFDIVGFATLKVEALVRGNENYTIDGTTQKGNAWCNVNYAGDANGECLIVRFIDYATDGYEPDGGVNFGTSAIGLTG